MLRFHQGIAKRQVEFVIANAMQKHVDAGEFGRRQVNLLAIVTIGHTALAQRLAELQQQ